MYAAPEIRDRYSFGDWQIDFATRRLTKDDEAVGLRSGEFALLKIFAVNPLKLMSRASIIALLGMRDTGQTERGLDVLVFRLRSVIEPDVGSPQYIQTVRGRGYMFMPCGEVSDAAGSRETRSGRVKPPPMQVSTNHMQMSQA